MIRKMSEFTSRKWFPPPRVPNWFAIFLRLRNSDSSRFVGVLRSLISSRASTAPFNGLVWELKPKQRNTQLETTSQISKQYQLGSSSWFLSVFSAFEWELSHLCVSLSLAQRTLHSLIKNHTNAILKSIKMLIPMSTPTALGQTKSSLAKTDPIWNQKT